MGLIRGHSAPTEARELDAVLDCELDYISGYDRAALRYLLRAGASQRGGGSPLWPYPGGLREARSLPLVRRCGEAVSLT